MIILCLLILPVIYILVKLVLYLIVRKHGKFSYDGFSAAGFAYDSEKDIFYSTKNAWQKNFGYTHAYDVWAPLFRMIIDTEPVRFNYDNKNWLITFWKGQYGIVTGAEVGIYCTTDQKVNKKTVYLPVDDCDMLQMSLTLYKNDKIITKVDAKHWWLAVFKLGMFSKPKELSMDVSITFSNNEMLEAFLGAFKKLRYSSKDFSVCNNTFSFRYKRPHSRKVWTHTCLTDAITQHLNHKNVKRYNKYLNEFIDNNGIDDYENDNVIILNDFIPDLLKNSPEPTIQTSKIAQKMINHKEKNVVIFDNRVFSQIKENSDE